MRRWRQSFDTTKYLLMVAFFLVSLYLVLMNSNQFHFLSCTVFAINKQSHECVRSAIGLGVSLMCP